MFRNKAFFHFVIMITLTVIYNANAKVLLHWKFDGTLGEKVDLCADEVLAVELEKFKRTDIAPDVSYSRPNPYYNTKGTSVEFLNNPALMTYGSALTSKDTDDGFLPDLSMLDTLTIEFFVYPYLVRDCTLIGKSGSTIPYQICMRKDGSICFIINEDRIISTDSDMVVKDKWFHIAVVLDRNRHENPLKIYVNGFLAGAGNIYRWTEDSMNDFFVGVIIDSDQYNTYDFFSGRIDELRISDRALLPNDFLVDVMPAKARYPYPHDRAEQFSCTTHLLWQPAPQAASQRIYFGHSPTDLKLLQEIGPDVHRIENSLLGGKLASGTTYYWRVDSQGKESMDYGYEEAGRGNVWSFTTCDNRVRGRLKWLLHLGQTPKDRFMIGNPPEIGGITGIESLIGKVYKPEPGQICDISDYPTYTDATTHPMMIWTPQYSENGMFINENINGSQFYHIYIQSPEPRAALLCLYYSTKMSLWINGEQFPKRELTSEQEYCHPMELRKGTNGITFTAIGSFFTARITDPNGNEFNDLTYSLKPLPPEDSLVVDRVLPSHYDAGLTTNVILNISAPMQAEPGTLSIIEYVPEGLSVIDSGEGEIIGNSIWWNLDPNDFASSSFRYSLSVPPDRSSVIPFLGYLYQNKRFHEITGDNTLFQEMQVSPADMADQIETIEIDPATFSSAEHASMGSLYIGHNEFPGLKPDQAGAWVEYDFTVQHSGIYHIVFEYGEFWTMFHHSADIEISIDGHIPIQGSLFPTTHSYPEGYVCYQYPWHDPHRKARWVVGQTALTPGTHTMHICFTSLYLGDNNENGLDDSRLVVTDITLINYPGFTVPGLAEPHHLDSYEHAPARLVYDRKVTELPGGRTEVVIYGTFYNLSQGNEVYFVDVAMQARSDQENSRFEIISFAPEVFHLPPEGEQDFVLTMRSTEPAADDYSELTILWLQGPPSSPSRRPYLFTTGLNFVPLAPYQIPGLEWSHGPMFIGGNTPNTKMDLVDPPELFLPTKEDLGFHHGRYNRNPIDFLQDQYALGLLPSVHDIFELHGWNYDYPGGSSWDMAWSNLMGSLYKRDIPEQAKSYVEWLSYNMVFYPINVRWDWARPAYLPNVQWDDVHGLSALAAHIRACQEGLVDDTEQFRILHNLVMPIFNSFWAELRTVATLTQDAHVGDNRFHIQRSCYGLTGDHTDGFSTAHPRYLKIEDDFYRMKSAYNDETVFTLYEPLQKPYPRGSEIKPWLYSEDNELECHYVESLLAIATASRDWAIIDQAMGMLMEILEKQKVFLGDGSFRNEPGSYGGAARGYIETLIKAKRLFGMDVLVKASDTLNSKIHNALLYALEFAFSNGMVPHLNQGGSLNQLDRAYHCDVRMLEELFPEDIENISRYRQIVEQEENRMPGDIIDNHNFMISGWGYAMLRSESGSWDRGMETLLASKHLLSDPGDHVSRDCLGIVVYGLGTILTPRYGSSWVGYRPPFLNQVMIDNHRDGNGYYGSFWHYDGRDELPSAVAHTGDGEDCSELDFNMSRWCIQFPEYLFDVYYVEAKDANEHLYDWSLINMGELEVIEPKTLRWEPYSEFLTDYWPTPGTRGAGEINATLKAAGHIVADWHVSNAPWESYGDPKLLYYPPIHSGRLRLIVADDSASWLINCQIGYYNQPDHYQANSQDILAIRKEAHTHAFIDTLETIAEDEEPFVKDVTIVSEGPYMQRLTKVTTTEGQDWVYLSGQWNDRANGEQPIADITTDADIVIWRITNGIVTRVYIANGSYAVTPDGQWQFESIGNHYLDSTN